jgi:biopolymer transport protein ExbD
MNLIPDRELMRQERVYMAPMVDFLFLIIAALMSLLVIRVAAYDMNIRLAEAQPSVNDHQLFFSEAPFIVLSIDSYGIYRWVTDKQEERMGKEQIEEKLKEEASLFQDSLPKVLLYIDQSANWQSIADLLVTVQKSGFIAYPLYQSIHNPVFDQQKKTLN